MAKFKASLHTLLAPDYVVSTSLKDKKLTTLQTNLGNNQRFTANAFNCLYNYTGEADRFRNTIADCNTALPLLDAESEARRILRNVIENSTRDLNRRLGYLRDERVNVQNYYLRWKRDISDLQQYQAARTFSTCTVGGLLAPLANHPHILRRPKSLVPQMYKQGNHIKFVCVLHNLKMTPLKNQYKCINKGGPVAPMPLGKVKVVFNLTNNQTFLETIGNDPRHYRTNAGWGRAKKVHPHILHDYSPCLGDFAPPLNEALNSYDLGTAIDIVCCYLETVDPNDGAGSYWTRWVIPEDGNDYYIRRRYDGDYDGNGYRYQQGEDGYFTAISRVMDELAERVKNAKINTIPKENLETMIEMISEAATPPTTDFEDRVTFRIPGLEEEVDEDHARAMLVAEGETTLDRVAAELAHTMMLAQEAFTEEHEDEALF